MKSRLFILMLTTAALLSACAKAPEKSQEPVVEKSSPFVEISSDSVAFVRMHPGAAQKNVYATWKHYLNQENNDKVWRFQKEDISSQAQTSLEALFAAAQTDLIPSDKLYACRYRDNMPQYRLNFTHNNKTYAIISTSACQNGAPWNVIIDGKSFVQISGAIGTALNNLLNTAGLNVSIGDTPAILMFNEPLQLEDFQLENTQIPAAWFDTEFRKDPDFADTIQSIETLFGPLDLPEIACNQAKSNNCKAVSAKYTLKFATNCEFAIPIKFDSGKVSANLPSKKAFETLANASKSSVFKAWTNAPRQEPIRVTYDNPDECKLVHGLAKHFDQPDHTACESWKMTSKDSPSAILYTGLQAIWLEPDKNYKEYFNAVRQMQSDNKETRFSYGQFSTPDKSTNLFVRLDGRPIAFVTKNGKTTINQP